MCKRGARRRSSSHNPRTAESPGSPTRPWTRPASVATIWRSITLSIIVIPGDGINANAVVHANSKTHSSIFCCGSGMRVSETAPLQSDRVICVPHLPSHLGMRTSDCSDEHLCLFGYTRGALSSFFMLFSSSEFFELLRSNFVKRSTDLHILTFFVCCNPSVQGLCKKAMCSSASYFNA